MVGITALWLPILLSAVAVFLVSAVIHMVIGYHNRDFAKIPGEDGVREAMRKEGVKPGDYAFPHASCPGDLKAPEMLEKFKQGPVGFVTIIPSGPPAMGKSLVLWFLYSLFVGFMTAYVAGRVFGPGADYLQVFRIAGTAAFLAYAGSQPIASIWMGRNWSTTGKNMVDGLIYALVTAGMFGWLWPD